MKLSTLYTSYQDLLIDLNLFGKIISTSLVSREDIEGALLSELQQSTPPPKLEDARYVVSRKAEHFLLSDSSEIPVSEGTSALGYSEYNTDSSEDLYKKLSPVEFNSANYSHPMSELEVQNLKESILSGNSNNIEEVDSQVDETTYDTYDFEVSLLDISNEEHEEQEEQESQEVDVYDFIVSDIAGSNEIIQDTTEYDTFDFLVSDIVPIQQEVAISEPIASISNMEVTEKTTEYSDEDEYLEEEEYDEEELENNDVEVDIYDFVVSDLEDVEVTDISSTETADMVYDTFDFNLSKLEPKTEPLPSKVMHSPDTATVGVTESIENLPSTCKDVVLDSKVDTNTVIDNNLVEKQENKVTEPTSSEKTVAQTAVLTDVPTDLVLFLRKYPKSELQLVLKYFDKKDVEKALKLGKILRKKNKLFV